MSLFGLLLISIFAFADVKQAPPAFSLKSGEKAVYVDFEKAQYDIVVDVAAKKTVVNSKIWFKSSEKGLPIFDLVPEPTNVTVDGHAAIQELTSTPLQKDYVTDIRVLKTLLKPGHHVMTLQHELPSVNYDVNGATYAFFMSDVDARGLLEQYLPASFEYDQVEMSIHLKIDGASEKHVVMTNGQTREVAENEWNIQFPKYFTESSLYFHFSAESRLAIDRSELKLASGKTIPVTVYALQKNANLLPKFTAVIPGYIEEFESTYGDFSHPSITVFATGLQDGGMEYSGATISGLWALKHELAHSYFARGVMPANGNAGWIDEAMATISGGPTDPGYLPSGPTYLGAHSDYMREMDQGGYTTGSGLLMSFEEQTGKSVKLFLSQWYAIHNHTTVTNSDLEQALESFFGEQISAGFRTYVYGVSSMRGQVQDQPQPPRVHLTLDEAFKALK